MRKIRLISVVPGFELPVRVYGNSSVLMEQSLHIMEVQ